MSLETRLRNTGVQPGGGGGSSGNSGGLAGTGGFFVFHSQSDPTVFPNSRLLTAGGNVNITTNGTQVIIAANTGGASNSAGLMGTGNFLVTWSSDPLLTNERILIAGSSISLRTDGTSIYIDAQTGGGSSIVYAPTGGPYLAYNSDASLVNELILRAGSSITTHSDGTFFYINAVTNSAVGGGQGYWAIMPQQAKLYANNSAARIDAGTPLFRLLFSPTTQQYGNFSFIVPPDYGSNPFFRVYYGADSTIAVARSVSWIVDLWGMEENQGRTSGYYVDTFGADNIVSVALSAGYSSGTLQMLTIPLAIAPSFAASRLVNLRLSGSGGLMGNSEFIEGSFEYTKA